MFKFLIFLFICMTSFAFADKRTSVMITQEKEFSSIVDKIDIKIPVDLTIEKSNSNSYQINLEKTILPKISIQTKGNKLVISSKKSFNTKERLFIKIKIKNISSLTLENAIDVKLTDLNEKNLYFYLDGAIDLYAKNSIVENVKIISKGSFDINLENLIAKNTNLILDGSGDIKLNSLNTLSIKSKGNIDIYYIGNPQITKKINSNTNIEKLNGD